jgi:hypothetical protein
LNPQRTLKVGSILLAGLLAIGGLLYFQVVPGSPEEALEKFHLAQVAEDQLIDPLILAGKKVVPLLIKEIKDKNMQQRRYAIAALGHLEDPSALPTLEIIFKDDSEIDYYRCDALEAIALLDSNVGRALAKEHTDSSISCISQLSRSFVMGTLPNRRTYLQALIGWHQ